MNFQLTFLTIRIIGQSDTEVSLETMGTAVTLIDSENCMNFAPLTPAESAHAGAPAGDAGRPPIQLPRHLSELRNSYTWLGA